jgi:hemolysin III
VTDIDGRPLRMTWRRDRAEQIADGVVHIVGLGLCITGAIVLTVVALRSAHIVDLVSALTYGIALVTGFAFSAAYNLWPVSPLKWILRRFDHAAIYLLIAGTYTPFVLQLRQDRMAIALLVVIWLIAAVGITFKFALPGRFDRVSIVLYLALGWSGVVIVRDVMSVFPASTLVLLALGGMLYTVGVVFYVWKSLRFHTAIWHGFVLLAATCHYFAVLDTIA